jgi:2-oxoglutarate ferredoxin oxidoreductase subunit delta
MQMGKVEINAEACKSCQYCVISCPKKVLAVGDKVNSKGYLYVVAAEPENCIGCAMCAQICPEAAIEVWK